jgi:tetratricopeptide (TPR) repeat protein
LEDAIREYQQALELREQLHGAQGLPLASTLNNLGAASLAQGNHEVALSYFSRAREIHELAYQDQEHPDWATTLNNLGMAYQFMQDLDQAEALFQESFAMRKRILPPNHPHLAGSLNNLGLIEEERGRVQEAAALFTEALALAQEKAPAGHPLLVQIQENLSAVQGE